MNEEELYKLLNIPYKPWIELTDEEIQLFEKNNNYIKQLKQQLKDKDEKISKIKDYCLIEREDVNGSKCDDILEILETNKED